MSSAVGGGVVPGRIQRSTPDLLRNLRNLRVMVVHPRDVDGELLTQQLRRIGCRVATMWPPLPLLPDTVDLVFCAVRPDDGEASCTWMNSEPRVPLIAVVSYENPTIIDAAMRMGALALLTSPLRSTGILSCLAIAQYMHEEFRLLRHRIVRLQQKILSTNQISQAKAILVRTRGVDDAQAYRIIREQAMSKRATTEEIARAIIDADGILSFSLKTSP